jgi:hypothetical protein
MTAAGPGGPDPATEPVADLSLDDIFAAAAEDLADVTRESAGGGATWSTGGRAFASLTGSTAEFRLDPLVAGAAVRTPDTRPSERGSDWVRFSPGALDDGAVDRAEAWFLSAYRRAARTGS